MKRRKFISNAAIAGSGLLTGSIAQAKGPTNKHPAKNEFKLKYAPHFGMFKNNAGEDLLDQLQFMADMGFTALEDNGMMKRTVATQEQIAKKMSALDMTMGVFVIDGGDNWKTSLTTGKAEFKEHFINTCKKAVEVAKRVNAKWMTVVPGFFDRSLAMGFQTANVIDALRGGAEVLEPNGLVMVLEPLSDTPELFLRHSDQTYMICKALDSPACKILYDIYHMQRNEGQIIENIDACWDEIPYFQIGDNPGRKEPTSGEINYLNVFKHIHDKGYSGVMGMEHGNLAPGKEGEMALIKAYVKSDSF